MARPAILLDPPLWPGRTGAGVSVAVVDSGANVDHPHLGPVARGIAIGPDGTEHDDWVDRLGHGTAVASAIREKAPEAELRVVKVFHHDLSTSVPAIARALERAVEDGARLVNLSLGTPKEEHAFRLGRAVEAARAAGAVIVSARRHRSQVWWPGCLEGVVGVEADPGCPRHGLRLAGDPDGTPIVRASPYPRPIPGIPPERNLNGVSFAVANVTGLLACLLEARPEVRRAEEVWTMLASA